MSWRARPAIALLGCLPVLLRAERARALEIGLEMSSCAQLSAPRVRELMELELTTKVVLPRGSEPLSALVSLSCRANEISIQVSDSTTNKLVSRKVVVDQPDPDVRVRAVALAAAELVLTSWMELMLSKPAQHERPAPPQVKEDRRAASKLVKGRTAADGGRVDALLALGEYGGSLRGAPGNFGAGARVSLAGGALGVDADVIGTFETRSSSLGRVRSNTWSVALRPAFRLERGRWLASAGVGARAGLARLEGSAADPSASESHVVAGGWGGPLAHANLGVALDHVVGRLGGEVGFALRGVSGSVEGHERAGVRGPWFMLTLGIGWGS